MTLEELYSSIPSDIDIDYFIFKNCESLSAPIGDRFVIAIDPTKIKSEADEKEKVAHELEHCETGSFYSPTTDPITRRQCEVKTERRTYLRLVPIAELQQVLSSGITEPWELADHFGVSEQFMQKTMQFYSEKDLIFRQ